MRNIVSTLSAAVLLGLGAPAHAALSDIAPDERTQAARADLVFVGTVADVRYGLSGEKDDAQRVPHTFVTYNVENVLHGEADGKQITLRFIGGRGDKARFLTVSGQPLFDLNDRDLLMVAENGISGCPLVDCSDGRYRLIQGKVFSEEGQAIELDAKGSLMRAGFFDLPEVMTHKVSQTTMRLVDQFEQGEERVEFSKSAGGAHIDDAQLIERVQNIARALGKATPGTFRSAAADKAFSVSFEVTAAPEVSAEAVNADGAARSMARTAQERAEEAAVRASGGNPAIGEYKEELNKTQGEK